MSELVKVTNYGLGGLVEEHNDPYGYNEGAPVPPERADLVHSGDIIATVMGEQMGLHYMMREQLQTVYMPFAEA